MLVQQKRTSSVIVPAAATVAGALFFNEPIWAAQIVGGVVIVLGLVWIGTERITPPGK